MKGGVRGDGERGRAASDHTTIEPSEPQRPEAPSWVTPTQGREDRGGEWCRQMRGKGGTGGGEKGD